MVLWQGLQSWCLLIRGVWKYSCMSKYRHQAGVLVKDVVEAVYVVG